MKPQLQLKNIKNIIITVILNEDWTYKDKSEIIDEMKMNQ